VGIPITRLAEPVKKAHKALGGYLPLGRNCYTFARMVYDAAKELYPAQRDTMERAERYHMYRAVYGEIFTCGVGTTTYIIVLGEGSLLMNNVL
jgi:hypothetical protein